MDIEEIIEAARSEGLPQTVTQHLYSVRVDPRAETIRIEIPRVDDVWLKTFAQFYLQGGDRDSDPVSMLSGYPSRFHYRADDVVFDYIRSLRPQVTIAAPLDSEAIRPISRFVASGEVVHD